MPSLVPNAAHHAKALEVWDALTYAEGGEEERAIIAAALADAARTESGRGSGRASPEAPADAPRWIAVDESLPTEREKVDVWIDIYASPRSMGMSDASRELNVWRVGKKWFHVYEGKDAEIYSDYITHWAPSGKSPDNAPPSETDSLTAEVASLRAERDELLSRMASLRSVLTPLHALAEKATPGKWKVRVNDDEHVIKMGTALKSGPTMDSQHEIRYEHGLFLQYEDGEDVSPAMRAQYEEADANARLIVALRNALPTLLATLEPTP